MTSMLHYLGLNKLTFTLISLWALLMIFVPIGIWTIGMSTVPIMMMIATTFQAAAVLVILSQGWGWKRAAMAAVLVGLMGWMLEAVGTATGWPFGQYTYTELLQPQVAHVPLLIPLAWFMMLPVSWAVAFLLTTMHWSTLSSRSAKVSFALLAAAAMTAWDLFLDPQMVMWDFWRWLDPGDWSYFGIPWQNYFGWLLGSVIMTTVVWLFVRPDWSKLPTRPLLVIYSITWFLETFGLLFFWGLVGPALVGGLVMGLFMALAWRQSLREDPLLKQRVETLVSNRS